MKEAKLLLQIFVPREDSYRERFQANFITVIAYSSSISSCFIVLFFSIIPSIPVTSCIYGRAFSLNVPLHSLACHKPVLSNSFSFTYK